MKQQYYTDTDFTRGIVVRIKGGLGNQFFQYSTALAVAARNRMPLFIDSFTGFPIDPLNRQYRLHLYPITGSLLSQNAAYETLRTSRFERKWKSYRENLRQRFLHTTFDPAMNNLTVKRRAVLEGFWNSPLYFDDCEDIIRAQLGSPILLSPGVLEMAERLREKGSVGLHRRYFGLERSNRRANIRWAPSPAYTLPDVYYTKALRYLMDRIDHELTVYIFSDAPDRAAEGLPRDLKTEVIADPGRYDYEDLYLFSQCRSQVIANSTFSWWGAWLGERPGQVVCAPQFFGNNTRDKFLQHVYPSQWNVIPLDA